MTDVPIFPGHPSTSGESEEMALARQARTDSACFAELYRLHAERVYRYLLVRVGDPHLAQDLASQTFLSAMEGIGSYQGKGSFAAWLFGIAKRQVALHFRRHRFVASLDAADELASQDPPLEEGVETKLELERVANALRHLAPDRAEALALRLFGGLSAAEVGELLGKSEAAVKMLVHRGVRDLQTRFHREEGNDE